MRNRVQNAGMDVKRCVTHGNAWSIYFDDPDGNLIENSIHMPWYVPQPPSNAIDLNQQIKQIMAFTEAHCREDPQSMTKADREDEMAKMMRRTPEPFNHQDQEPCPAEGCRPSRSGFAVR